MGACASLPFSLLGTVLWLGLSSDIDVKLLFLMLDLLVLLLLLPAPAILTAFMGVGSEGSTLDDVDGRVTL